MKASNNGGPGARNPIGQGFPSQPQNSEKQRQLLPRLGTALLLGSVVGTGLVLSTLRHWQGFGWAFLAALGNEREIGFGPKLALAPVVIGLAASLPAFAAVGGGLGGALHGYRAENARQALRDASVFLSKFNAQFAPNLISFLPMARQPVPLSNKAKLDTNTRIAIIGAGASGIAAARRLIEKGYRHVTVFESKPQAGGKVNSTRDEGQAYDMGAVIVAGHYLEIKELAKRVGLHERTGSPIGFYSWAKGQLMSPWGSVAPMELASNIAKYIWLLLTDFNDSIKSRFQKVHPLLAAPTGDFLKAMGLSALGTLWKPMVTGFAYGNYEKTPAVYFLEFVTLRAALNWGEWRYWEGGFAELFRRLAALPGPDFRYNSPVKHMERTHHGVIIETKQGLEEFDQVIVTTNPSETLKFLDSSPEEKDLFQRVETYNLRVYLVRAEGLAPGWNMIAEDVEEGRLISWDSQHPGSNLFTLYAFAGHGMSDEDVLTKVRQDVERLGGSIKSVEEKRRWRYFPHVRPQDIRAGFFERIAALQGQNRTTWVGSTLGFETVSTTVIFSQSMVEDRF
ncbi:MAG: FAD-dependent oxidoreductase [Elusimicrobia bacterium]|nr:FAD-dependent oxidoreductase [Elusimicrobiota bacterium]